MVNQENNSLFIIGISQEDVVNTININGVGLFFTASFSKALKWSFFKRFGSDDIWFCETLFFISEKAPYKWIGPEIKRV